MTPSSIIPTPTVVISTPTLTETWNLSGEMIVSVEEETEIKFFKENKIIKVSFDGNKTTISPKGYSCTNPKLSPDKRSLLFRCNQPNNSGTNLFVYDLLSGETSILTTPKFHTEDLVVYAWKADSSSVLVTQTPSFWVANINDENWNIPSKIYFVDMAKGNYYKLLENKTSVINIWWSKKQDKILIQAAEVDPEYTYSFPFFLLDLEGKVNALNIEHIPGKTASVSSDGDLIAFVSLDTHDLHIVSALNGDQLDRISPTTDSQLSDQLPIWSLNDKTLSYSVCTNSLPKLCKVFLYNMETKETEPVSCKCIKMTWLDDEKYFAYIQDRTLFVYSMRVNQSRKILSDNLIWDIPILIGK
jgi:hypothetical protein